MLEIETFGCRRRILDLDGLEKGISLHDLFAIRQAQLCELVIGRFLDDELPVAKSFSMVQDGSVRRGPAVECLQLPCKPGIKLRFPGSSYFDIVGVKLEGFVCVCNRKPV